MNEHQRRQRKEVPVVEAELKTTPTTSIDLMYLERKGERPTQGAVDHEINRVWSYAPKDKTILGGMRWIQERIAKDTNNGGHKGVKVMMKSDREISMVALQHEIHRICDGNTIPKTAR